MRPLVHDVPEPCPGEQQTAALRAKAENSFITHVFSGATGSPLTIFCHFITLRTWTAPSSMTPPRAGRSHRSRT